MLEVGEFIAVPFAGRILTQLGATVFKIEPLAGDSSRRVGPFLQEFPSLTSGALFQYLNRGKHSIAVKLSSATGRSILERLTQTADVVIADESLLEQLGWDEGVRWLKDQDERTRAVLTPFGLTGRHAHYRSTPLVSYHSSVTGSLLPYEPSNQEFPDRGPVAPGAFWSEYQCGGMMALPILAALLTEATPFIELSRQEALMNLIRPEVERRPSLGRTPTFKEPFRTSIGGLMKAADGYICVGMLEDHQWQRWLNVLGDPSWARDERLVDQKTRLKNWTVAYAYQAQETIRYGKEDLFRRGQAAGVAIAPILTVREALDGQLLPLSTLQGVNAAGAHVQWPGWPAEFDEAHVSLTGEAPAPFVGQSTLSALEHVGFERSEVAAMHRFGIVKSEAIAHEGRM